MKSFEEREKTAKWALFYIDKIAEKFSFKLNGLSNPYEEFKILIHDDVHAYDNEAVKMMIKTYKRKHFNISMTKYRKMNNGRFAYIFTASRMK